MECGENSPEVNTFPINGLRSDGECNFQGVQLLPGSLSGGKGDACNGSTLEIRNNQLVGLRSNGTIACDKQQLEGASFTLQSWRKDPNGSGKLTLPIKIASVSPYRKPDNGEVRTAYRMIAAGGSLCDPHFANEARKLLGLAVSDMPTPPATEHDVLIPVFSELYDKLGFPLMSIAWARKSPEWLNLACVDDALAKRSLYDLYTDSMEHSRSALMMLVANYCGQRHVTKRGAKLDWRLFDGKNEPTPCGVGPLEAIWRPEGAVCVSKLRLWSRDSSRTRFAGLASCPDCTEERDWLAAVRRCDPDGVTGSTVPTHQLPACEECGDACNGRLFHSYVKETP